MPEQHLIDSVVAIAYGSEAIEFDLEDVVDDIGYTDSAGFDAIDLCVLAEFLGFSDKALAEYQGLDEGQAVTDAVRLTYALERFGSWIDDPDHDLQGTVRWHWLRDSNNRKALLAHEVFGYSFSGVEYKPVGVFRSEDELRNHFRDSGYFLNDEELEDGSVLLQYWTE